MIDALVNLKGNPRICIFTEPLWAVPYNLYLPYVSVYMLALGLRDGEIGLIASVGLFFQIFMSLLSGPITDKLGRRLTTLIFDIVSWSLPTLVWAIAQDFRYFFVAALLNSVLRITGNSWNLLVVEDAQKKDLVSIWSWSTIAGILSGFFAPIAGVLVARYSLVVAVRILYVNACFFMTLKFFILYHWGTETKQGLVRMRETAGVPFLKLLGNYRGCLKKLVGNPYTRTAFLIAAVVLVNDTVKNVFWSIMVVKQLGLPESSIAVFPLLRSILMLAFYLFVTPRLNHLSFKKPLLTGFFLILVSNAILVLSPAGSYLFVTVSALLDAVAGALIPPFKETLIADSVDPHDRAGIMGLFNVALLVLATPFGWVSGILSERSRFLPFLLLIVLAAAGLFLTVRITRYKAAFSDGEN